MNQRIPGTRSSSWLGLFGAALLCGVMTGCPGRHIAYMPPSVLLKSVIGRKLEQGQACFPVLIEQCTDPESSYGSAWERNLLCDSQLEKYHLDRPIDDFCHSVGEPFVASMLYVSREEILTLAEEAGPRYGVPSLERELWHRLETFPSSRIPICHVELDLKKIDLDPSLGFFCGYKNGLSMRIAHVDFARLPDGRVYTLSSLDGSESCLRHRSGHSISSGIFAICFGKNKQDGYRLMSTISLIWSSFWRSIAQRKTNKLMRECVPHPEDD